MSASFQEREPGKLSVFIGRDYVGHIENLAPTGKWWRFFPAAVGTPGGGHGTFPMNSEELDLISDKLRQLNSR